MWLPKFIQSLFMLALLSTQVIAGNKDVPRPSQLGLSIHQKDKYGWQKVTNDDGFFTKVFVAKDPSFIQASSLQNPTATLKSYQALLSIWESQTRLTVRNLEQIMYTRIVGEDMLIINQALEMLGHDPSGTKSIFGIVISKNSPKHAKIWDLLSTASFATDAVEICAEYREMSNRYVESFKIGRYHDSDKWVHIKFATKTE
ncbi:hypothetical protein HOO65_050011 [Ceratocystis lukuohia]|uniref:Uncharacterized protein n=1 Tax=Ceratocystis lukuohia TaxID=2019550 RepID=A0ABR4MF34_9PEZI